MKLTSKWLTPSRITWVLVVFITAIGSYLRTFGQLGLFWGLDDLYTLEISNQNSLWEVFYKSYEDAHPPLRNIYLYLIRTIHPSPEVTRLISLIPGILIIPGIALLTKKTLNNNLSILFSSAIVAFSPLFINLSQSTRPYMLMNLEYLFYFWGWWEVTFRKSWKGIFLYFIAGILLVFTSYSSILVLIPLSILGLFQLLRPKFSATLILSWMLFSTCHFYIFLHQILEFENRSLFARGILTYLNEFMFNSTSNLGKNFVLIFNANYFNFSEYPHTILSIYIFGMINALFFRNWIVFFLGTAPFGVLLFLSENGLYPFMAGRHTEILSFHLISVLAYSTKKMVSIKNLGIKIPLFAYIFSVFWLNVINSIPTISEPKLINSGTSMWDHGPTKEEFDKIKTLLINKSNPDDVILIPENFYEQIKKLEPHSTHILDIYTILPNHICKGHFDIPEQKLISCFEESKDNRTGSNFSAWCLNCIFDPENSKIFKNPKIKIENYTYTESTKTHTFSFKYNY